MKFNKGRVILGVSLLATVLAVIFAPAPGNDGVALAARKAGSAVSAAQPQQIKKSSAIDVLRIRPRDVDEDDDGAKVFASTQWTPAIPKTTVGPANAAPPVSAEAQLPPLPFKLLGRYQEDGQDLVFLQFNDQNLVVRVGDTIADHYKVQSLKGPLLTLLYTPLNQPQTMDVGVLADEPN
ncbi:putative secretion system X translation initiation factor [Collimonas arenae]|uniref:Putative secretion system X translation initiation factor n=1 Tax=Collimonas arenae TaxID=279058 RepID=A0A0A1FCK3_9BURK|nr:hypothetical protein [Collimonas arenae]AIY41399.1 putative secretion system X translation initiation factor [Collimonas arenae]